MEISIVREAYRNAVKTIELPRTGKTKYVVNRISPDANTIKLTKSYLRSEIQLQSNVTNYVFPILTNDVAPAPPGISGVIQPTEQRLNQQDVFFCHRLGFYAYMKQTGGGNASFLFELMTFPNANFFGAGGLNLDLMVGLWTSGVLNVTVNNNVLTPAWDIMQHFVTNQTQIPAIPTGQTPYFNQVNYKDDGMVVVEPNWVLNGGNKNLYTITYPQQIANMGVGSNQIFLVLKFEGFLAQNCSSIMDN